MAASAFFVPLTHESLLAVRGPDAAKFLQGQLTCNLNYLDEQHSSLGARCNVKGRMLSSFRILAQGDGFLLALASELLDAQLADLKKYAVFSKANLNDESTQWQRFGLAHAESCLQALGLQAHTEIDGMSSANNLIAITLPGNRIELWCPAAQAAQVREQLAQQLPEATLNDWLLGQIRAGIGQVFGKTRELFIPQMINLQAVGGVSFKKGCYTGQEIVARMQYLGKLKRRLKHFALAANTLPEPGLELFSPVHQSSVGEVVLAAIEGERVELLAVVQEDAAQDGRIHLGDSQGPALEQLELPYQLDADREIQR